jgi:SAM-dependent methyltransferase
VIVAENWWERFFDGLAVQFWLDAVSPEDTEREVEWLETALAAPAAGEILDVPCGGGRVSRGLASRGYRLTGVDLSHDFLSHARASPGVGGVTWEHRDMRDLPWPGRFDGAFCVGNSFGYLDDAGNAAFLRAVATALKPSARFVLDTPMVLELLLRHLQDRPWWKFNDTYLLVRNEYDHTRSRLDIEYTFLSNDRTEVKYGSHQAYRYAELRDLLQNSGFAVSATQPWTNEAATVTFIATRQ